MNPLDPNCTEVKVDANNKVVGVKLGITPIQDAKYEVYAVRLKDEYEANGETVANCSVLDKNGISTGLQVRLAWPGAGPLFENSALPGNQQNIHVITNGYDAWKSMGPLAIFVGGHNAPQSDIVFGLGLPWNRHVSFVVTFKEKGAVLPPPEDELARLKARADKFEAWATAWSRNHPGDPIYG